MTNKAEDITKYDFKSSDELLLDTNVWLLTNTPQKPGDKRVAVYSRALANILAAKSNIYIDVLIVSEFINRYARLKYNLQSRIKDFKIFRRSKEFKPIAQDIAADVKSVLKHCTRTGNGFESCAIDDLLDDFSLGNSDFNDQIITTLCQSKGLKLVTDDGDFKGCGIPVLTANPRLIT